MATDIPALITDEKTLSGSERARSQEAESRRRSIIIVVVIVIIIVISAPAEDFVDGAFRE